MGSRYDAAIFRGVTLDQFAQAFRKGVIGAEVSGPWEGPSGTTVAQIDTASGSNVIVVAPPMETPRGVDTLLASQLGAESLYATVWDSVGSYSLSVVGEGVDRYLSADASAEEIGEEPSYASGDRLPEEPSWPELDEAYVQAVFMGRCGIDPGSLSKHQARWYSLDPLPGSQTNRRS